MRPCASLCKPLAQSILANADALTARCAANRECISPYLTGEDVNSRPDQSPSRAVINFGDCSLDTAERTAHT